MVQINIWFVPRSRSTALVKCLSNIPDSKVFFENFLWAYYLGDEDSVHTNNPEQLGDLANVPIASGFNKNSIIKQLNEDKSKVTILKDFFYTLDKGRYEEVIPKDSVNIFLVREPKYVMTSLLPLSKTCFWDVAKTLHKDVTLFYESLLDGIKVVSEICSNPPVIIDGALLSTNEGSRKVVKAICEKAGLEFTESMLTWTPTDGFDPSWILPEVASTSNNIFGTFLRANSSSNFEDSKEREVDLKSLAEEKSDLVADIEACKPYYDKLMNEPFLLKLD